MRVKEKPANDELLCRRRREEKWLVSPPVAASLESRVAELMPLVRHGGREASPVASLYLDTTDRALSTRAQRSPGDCLKARVRAYLDDDGVARELVFELKRHVARTSRKWRLRVEPAALVALCDGELPRATPEEYLELLGHRPLQPVVTVTYRRRTYQSGEMIRVTFDHDVAWHETPASLEDAVSHLTHGTMPRARGRLPQVVVEVKQTRGPTPRVVRELLSNQVRQLTFSKFVTALGNDGTG